MPDFIEHRPRRMATAATPGITAAVQVMEFAPEATLDIRELEKHPTSRDGSCFHRSVAIEWEGGVLWLDMSEQSDHYCVDVRQFVPATEPIATQCDPEDPGADLQQERVELAGQGVFTIVNGRRQALGGPFADNEALEDPDGTPVRGHGWNGGYVVTLMHDKEPGENQTNRPAGPGRG